MDRTVPIDEASANLSDLITETADHPVYITRTGERVAVLIDVDKFERLMDAAEELQDIAAYDAVKVEDAGYAEMADDPDFPNTERRAAARRHRPAWSEES